METFSVFAANKMSDGLEEQCVYKSALFTCKSPVLYILQMQGLVMSCWDITFQVFCTLYSILLNFDMLPSFMDPFLPSSRIKSTIH